jgi:hypothetical protein
MDPFHKSYITTDLASPHRPCHSTLNNLRTSSSTRRVNKKPKTLSCSWMNISSPAIWCTQNIMKFNSKAYRIRFSSSFHKYKNSSEIFVLNKVYRIKFIVIIFASLPHQVHFSNLDNTNVYTPPYMKQKLIILQHHEGYQLVSIYKCRCR